MKLLSPEASQFRRRMVGIAAVSLVCASLVVLPMAGLWRIGRTTNDSHDYTSTVASVTQLENDLLVVATGPYEQMRISSTAANRNEVEVSLARLRAELSTIQAKLAVADSLGIGVEVRTELAQTQQLIDSISQASAEPALSTTSAAATAVAEAQALAGTAGQFIAATLPVAERMDDQRQLAQRQALVLLAGSALIALLAIGAFAVVDDRRIRRWLAAESARRVDAEETATRRADIVSMASHELRNPLTVVTMATELLSRAASGRQDPEVAELAADAHAAAMRAETLVAELLDMGRIEADRLQLTIGATPLLPALADVLTMSEGQHGAHAVRVEAGGDPSVEADPQRLRVILRNLIDNALKYSPPGSEVVISVGVSGERVSLDVQDQGAGVPAQDHERVFEKYERLPGTSGVPGVGIGLYLSRELARRMAGDLRCVESPRGALFRLDLPSAVSRRPSANGSRLTAGSRLANTGWPGSAPLAHARY